MLDFSKFEAITFDCYGTLIDWETGIMSALRPILSAHGKNLPDDRVLELYGEFEVEAEQGEYQNYKSVLQSVVRSFGANLSFTPSAAEIEAISESLPGWSPWPDTVAALKKLGTRYKLAIISNIDDDLFATTRPKLPVEFHSVTTAQQAGCYKPALGIFRIALEKLGIAPGHVLHVGQSIYHDVLPAHSLGLAAVWVNRPSRRTGVGAVKKVEGKPDLEVQDLQGLATAACG
jgi:2-haloacid dehalogenase